VDSKLVVAAAAAAALAAEQSAALKAAEDRVSHQMQEADQKLEGFKQEQRSELQSLRDETKAELTASEQRVTQVVQTVGGSSARAFTRLLRPSCSLAVGFRPPDAPCCCSSAS